MSFGTFVVTYRRPQIIERTIGLLLAQTRVPDLIVVVDNGSSPDVAAMVRRLGNPRVVYEDPGDNLGSAGGVAHGMEFLHGEGFDWIHSVDDDDPPRTGDTVERLMALAERNDDPKLGAVAAFGSHWDWKRGKYQRIPDAELVGDVRVDTVGGNSQLTVRREVVDEIGTPEKRFFFGFYDPLYCLRMGAAGYHILLEGALTREYRLHAGKLGFERHRNLLPPDPYHAIWRRYYVTRNYIYRMTRTFDRPDLARREAARAVSRSMAAWGRGPRYGSRFTRLQLRGIVDGYRGRLGRTVDPQPKPS